MLQVTLSPLQTLQGAFTLIFVIISFILGLIIILRYRKYKQIELILVGLTWIFLVSPYWPDAITFILIITTGKELDPLLYITMGIAFVPPAHFTWMYAIMNFLYRKKKKIVVTLFTIEAIIYEIILFTLLMKNPDLIAIRVSKFSSNWSLFVDFYLFFSIGMFIITGFLFVRASLRSSNKEIQLKGKILLLAFIIFTIGVTLEVAIDYANEITDVIIVSFILAAAFLFYVGFTLPNYIKNIFIKNKNAQ